MRGELAKIAQAVATAGGNIIALVQFQGTDSTNRQVLIKVEGLPREKLLEVLKAVVISIEDVREM